MYGFTYEHLVFCSHNRFVQEERKHRRSVHRFPGSGQLALPQTQLRVPLHLGSAFLRLFGLVFGFHLKENAKKQMIVRAQAVLARNYGTYQTNYHCFSQVSMNS